MLWILVVLYTRTCEKKSDLVALSQIKPEEHIFLIASPLA